MKMLIATATLNILLFILIVVVPGLGAMPRSCPILLNHVPKSVSCAYFTVVVTSTNPLSDPGGIALRGGTGSPFAAIYIIRSLLLQSFIMGAFGAYFE